MIEIDRRHFSILAAAAGASTFLPNFADLANAKTTIKEGYLALDDGVRIWYRQTEGDPKLPTAVFSHGGALNHTTGIKVLEYFSEKGHPTITFDHPGHGKSDFPTEGYESMDDYSKSFDAILDVIPSDSVIGIGHSKGGYTEMGYIRNGGKYADRFQSLVLFNSLDVDPTVVHPGIKVDEETTIPLQAIVQDILKQSKDLYDEDVDPSYPFDQHSNLSDKEIEQKQLIHTHPETVRRGIAAWNGYDVRGKISVPTLIIAGASDPFITEQMTRDMDERMPNSRLYLVPGGHNFILQNPDAAIKIIDQTENYSFLMQKR